MTMKRFSFDEHSERDYHDDGDFVDADIAQALYEALCDMLWKRGVRSKDKALAALAKARGEQYE